jgi:hypothetical protein
MAGLLQGCFNLRGFISTSNSRYRDSGRKGGLVRMRCRRRAFWVPEEGLRCLPGDLPAHPAPICYSPGVHPLAILTRRSSNYLCSPRCSPPRLLLNWQAEQVASASHYSSTLYTTLSPPLGDAGRSEICAVSNQRHLVKRRTSKATRRRLRVW